MRSMRDNQSDALPVMLTPRALAKLLHTSVKTLQRRRRAGNGIAYHKLGSRVLYSAADVIAHLQSAKV